MKSKFTNRNWEYETKCRRCGKLHVINADYDFNSIKFFEMINEYIQYPPQEYCNNCEIHTIQDLTAYSVPLKTIKNDRQGYKKSTKNN
jgi:uncharacterized OB-fold protein